MAKRIRGVAIYLDSAIDETADIGLYAVEGGNSVIRWIEADISSYSPTDTWKTDMLVPDWFEEISDGYDGTYGGTIGEVGMAGIRAVSAVTVGGVKRPLYKVLASLNVRLNGLRCDLVEFEISGGALVDPDGTVIFRGECGEAEFDEYVTTIHTQTALLNRRANLGTLINEVDFPMASKDLIGKPVPLTIGEFTPELDPANGMIVNGLAMFQRVADKEIRLNNSDITYGNLHPEIKAFPLLSIDDSIFVGDYRAYIVKLYGNRNLSGFGDVENLYLRVVSGTGKGQIRKILEIFWYEFRHDLVIIKLDSYFTTELEASGENRSWVSFDRVYREYNSDVWPCKAFVDNNGLTLNSGVQIYSIDNNEKYRRIPDYGYNLVAASENKTELVIQPELFTDNIDTLDGYVILPAKSVYPLEDSNLDNWIGADANLGRKSKVIDGIYGDRCDRFHQVISRFEGANDKHSITHARLYLDVEQDAGVAYYYKAIGFDLPVLPENFEFDSCYLGIKMWTQATHAEPVITGSRSSLAVLLRKFAYTVKTYFADDVIDESVSGGGATLNDLPDFYFEDRPATLNKYFYHVNPVDGDGKYSLRTGYTVFNLGIESVDEYNLFVQGLILLKRRLYNEYRLTDDTKIYEVAIIFKKKSTDIKDAVYSGYQGRLFNSTFGGYSATDLINTPKLALLHILMLQNWSETGENKNWGHEYPTAPLIDVSTNEGGLNFSELSILDNFKVRRQILNYEEMNSVDLLNSLCSDFFLVLSQDRATGNERISFIGRRYQTAPTVTITLDDIIGPISVVKSQPEKAIFCEPVVRYNYNQATGKYDGLIQVRNASAETYDASYVTGLTGPAAENAWNKAHLLWGITRKIETPPEQYTDKKWIYRADDAYWYLDTWFYYMGAVDTADGVQKASRDRLGFTVSYSTGKDFFKGQHILLDLVYHTEGNPVECVIERVSIGATTVKVEVMLMDNISEDDFYIIKTLSNTVEEWQKVIPEFGDDRDIDKVI